MALAPGRHRPAAETVTVTLTVTAEARRGYRAPGWQSGLDWRPPPPPLRPGPGAGVVVTVTTRTQSLKVLRPGLTVTVTEARRVTGEPPRPTAILLSKGLRHGPNWQLGQSRRTVGQQQNPDHNN